MARTGITQAKVAETSDTLLRTGASPTIERVRQVLGTGSPNTVVRLLEVWWAELGQRRLGHEAKLALPDAPEWDVAAASQLWLTALEAAKTIAVSARAGKREELVTERQAHIESASSSTRNPFTRGRRSNSLAEHALRLGRGSRISNALPRRSRHNWRTSRRPGAPFNRIATS